MNEYQAHGAVYGYPWTAEEEKNYTRFLAERRAMCSKAIHHIDGNPYNNDPANLRFVDIEENVR